MLARTGNRDATSSSGISEASTRRYASTSREAVARGAKAPPAGNRHKRSRSLRKQRHPLTGPTRRVVAGMDKGHSFTKGTLTKTYNDVKDSDLASQIAQRNGLTADVDDSKVVHDYVIQSNLSDYDFLMQRATVAGFRFNVDGKKLSFKKPQIGQGSAAKLVWRENIGRFAMEVNTYDQVSKISSSGWDPDKMKNMTSPAKKGDEYGTQGGQVTGAQLVKKMFGEVKSVLTVASGQQNLLDAVAKAEFNKRGGAFVAAEGRITGDPAVKAGTVIEVDKAGQRVNGQYYVTGSEHIFFADTGYATEFRAKRYAVTRQSSPVKDLAKLAKAVQEAAKKAQESAQKIKEAAAFALKAAREAAKRAQQACDSARALYSQVKQALEQVKSGAGDVAKTMLQQAEQQIAGIKGYLSEAGSKVSEAAGEAAAAADDAAKKALQTAHEAAGSVVDLAKNAYQHAQDAFDAVKAAALDAVHTAGDPDAPLSGPVQGIKKSLLAAAETALAIGKAGMTLANVAIAKGKSAIEMCAAKADAMAKPLIEAIGGDLSKVIDSVKQSGNASNQSILGAISSGAQHALDQAKKAVSQAQDAIAKAKEAVKEAQKTLKEQVGDKLKGYVDQAKSLVNQVKGTVDEYKKKFDEYKQKIEDTIDKYGGKWIKAGLYIKEHGDKAYKAGKAVFDGCKDGIQKCKEKKWDEAQKDVEPLKAKFEECKDEAKLCLDKLEEFESELPGSVKATLTVVVEKLKQMVPQGESTLQKTIDAILAKVGQLAQKAKEYYEKAKQVYEKAKADYDKYKKEFEKLKEFYEAAEESKEYGEKAWNEGKVAIAKCKEALQKVEKRDLGNAKKDGEEAKERLDAAQKDAQACYDKAQEAYQKLPETVKHALEQLIERLRGLMGKADGTLSSTLRAIESANIVE